MHGELAVTTAAAAANAVCCYSFTLINARTNDRGFIFTISNAQCCRQTACTLCMYIQFISAQRVIAIFQWQKNEDMKIFGVELFTCLLQCSRKVRINQCRECANNRADDKCQMEIEAINISFLVKLCEFHSVNHRFSFQFEFDSTSSVQFSLTLFGKLFKKYVRG